MKKYSIHKKSLYYEGLLILFSGRPAAGKTTVASKLAYLIEKKLRRKVYLIEFDYWRQKNFKKLAFKRELLTEMLKKLNSEVAKYILKKQIVIIESGGTTADINSREIIVNGISNVFDVRIECSFLRAFLRDLRRSLYGKSPRMKFLYFQAVIRNIFGREKIYLAGFNKPLEKISGFHISTEKNSIDQVAKKIFNNLNLRF